MNFLFFEKGWKKIETKGKSGIKNKNKKRRMDKNRKIETIKNILALAQFSSSGQPEILSKYAFIYIYSKYTAVSYV